MALLFSVVIHGSNFHIRVSFMLCITAQAAVTWWSYNVHQDISCCQFAMHCISAFIQHQNRTYDNCFV